MGVIRKGCPRFFAQIYTFASSDSNYSVGLALSLGTARFKGFNVCVGEKHFPQPNRWAVITLTSRKPPRSIGVGQGVNWLCSPVILVFENMPRQGASRQSPPAGRRVRLFEAFPLVFRTGECGIVLAISALHKA
jgi:hypothetical protein